MLEIHTRDRLLKKLLLLQTIEPDAIYRLSRFVIPFVYKSRPCLFSTLTKQGFELSEAIAPTRRFFASEIESNAELFILMQGYFLLPVDMDENELYLTISNMLRMYFQKRGIAGYTVLPTFACNARCVYSYEEGIKPSVMNEQTAEDVIAFIERTHTKDGSILLTWFGGEPFLNEHIIDLITQNIGSTQFVVPIGAEAFSGILRNNETAAFIVDCLKEETTKEQIVDAMCAEYDAPRERIEADVEKILDKLRSIGALNE